MEKLYILFYPHITKFSSFALNKLKENFNEVNNILS